MNAQGFEVLTPKEIAKFETRHAEDALTSLGADVAIYLDHAISEHADAVVKAMAALFALVPRATFKWYRTDTMERGKACTSRTFGMPAAWWKAGIARREFRFLEIQDGEKYHSIPHHLIRLSCNELEEGKARPWKPSLLRFAFPASFAWEKADDIRSLALLFGNEFPMTSGHGGFVIESNAYFEHESIRAAIPLALRYRGVDLDSEQLRLEFDFLKTINWLTLVGDTLLQRIGGRGEVRRRIQDPSVLVHDVKHGLVIQAGPSPQIGDVNRAEFLPSYRAVYVALKDLFADEFTPPFSLTAPRRRHEDQEKTQAWYHRFAKELP
jgi:hypothetical protein